MNLYWLIPWLNKYEHEMALYLDEIYLKIGRKVLYMLCEHKCVSLRANKSNGCITSFTNLTP